MSEPKKCAHSNCGCVCSDGKKYCSQICEDAAKHLSLGCDCPHPECGGRM